MVDQDSKRQRTHTYHTPFTHTHTHTHTHNCIQRSQIPPLRKGRHYNQQTQNSTNSSATNVLVCQAVHTSQPSSVQTRPASGRISRHRRAGRSDHGAVKHIHTLLSDAGFSNIPRLHGCRSYRFARTALLDLYSVLGLQSNRMAAGSSTPSQSSCANGAQALRP